MWWSIPSEALPVRLSWAVDSGGPERWTSLEPGLVCGPVAPVAATRRPETAWRARLSGMVLWLKRGVAALVVVVLLVPMATVPLTV